MHPFFNQLKQPRAKNDSPDAEGSKAAIKEKKKSRGKKNKQKEAVDVVVNAAGFHPPQQETSLDFSGLQIISKAEWKKLRNTYLNLQRKNMSQVDYFVRKYINFYFYCICKCDQCFESKGKLGYNQQLGTDQRPNLFVTTGLLCVVKWSYGTEYFVRYCRVFVITEFHYIY